MGGQVITDGQTVSKFGFDDKESSIHFDLGVKDQMDALDDGNSSTISFSQLGLPKKKKKVTTATGNAQDSARSKGSNMSKKTGKPKDSARKDGIDSSRLSQTSGTSKKSTVAKKKKVKEISDTTSVKSTKSKSGGTKKKKKSSMKDDSFDGDTSRSRIATPMADNEMKVEEPVVPEKPKREFKPTEKVRLMDQGIDMLRE